MNRPLVAIIAVVLCIGLIVLIFSFQFLLNIPAPSQETQHLLSTLSTEQQQAYLAQQYEILRTRQAGELKATQQAFLWSFVWRVIWIGSLIAVMTVSGIVIVRKSRYQATTTMTEPDGRSLTTRIPIIPETQQERIMLASAQVARNLALAQGDVNEQTQRMMQAIGATVKSLSTALPKQIHQASVQEPLSLSDGHILPQHALAAGDILSSPRHDKQFVIGNDHETREPVLCSFEKHIFHLNVAGQTGGGKTTSLKFFVAQWIQNKIVDRIFLCDNHLGNVEGLTLQMGRLTELSNVHTCREMTPKDMVERYYAEMKNRIEHHTPWHEAWMLILDEGLALYNGITQLKDMLTKGVIESRKFGMFLVLVAQTQKHTQIPTEIRDNFPAMFVHRMKPKQANLLLQDKDRARLTGKLQQGQAYFVDAIGQYEGIIDVPLVTHHDLQNVVDRCLDTFPSSGVIDLPLQEDVPLLTPEVIQQKVRAMLPQGLRLREVWQQVFVNGYAEPVMAESTFLTKFKHAKLQSDVIHDPTKRGWTPGELELLSRWVSEVCH